MVTRHHDVEVDQFEPRGGRAERGHQCFADESLQSFLVSGGPDFGEAALMCIWVFNLTNLTCERADSPPTNGLGWGRRGPASGGHAAPRESPHRRCWRQIAGVLYVKSAVRSSKPTTLAGDMDVAHRDIDIYNFDARHIATSAGTSPEERNSFGEVFLQRGWVDTFAAVHGDEGCCGWFSYWSVRAKNKARNRGLRLDYVLVSEAVQVLDAYILPAYADNYGDHCPVGVAVNVPIGAKH